MEKIKELSKQEIRKNNSNINSKLINEYARLKTVASKSSFEECSKERVNSAAQEAKALIEALDASNPLETMLATQMIAVHDLQQWFFAATKMSTKESPLNMQQYYANTITKLSHIFIQQASLLNKLQGHFQQKVTVEHVHIHNGAQAIVGNVQTHNQGEVENQK